MATSVSFNGSTYSIPANREARGWGTSLSSFLVDVANSSLSKAGGAFTLTADANLGATYGLVVKYIKSSSSNIAASGVVRFANNEGLGFRNQANDGDLVLKVDTINRLNYNGSAVLTTDSTDSVLNKTLVSPTITGTGSIAGTFTGNLTGNVTGNASGTAANVTGTVAIGNGGTGQTSANAALNALLPSQGSQSGKALTTDGTNAAWSPVVVNPMTTQGDLIYGGASGAPARIAAGATGTVFKGGTTPSWASIVNADIDASAAIAGSKIATATALTRGASKSAQDFSFLYTANNNYSFVSGSVLQSSVAPTSTSNGVVSVTNSPLRITALVDCIVTVSWNLYVDSTGTNWLEIHKNNTTKVQSSASVVANSQGFVTCTIQLAAADYIDFRLSIGSPRAITDVVQWNVTAFAIN